MKFGHVELFVKSPDESKDFYVNILGFALVDDKNPKTIWIKMDDTEILLREGMGSQSPNYQQTNSGLVIYTNDLLKSRKILEARGLVFKGIDGSEKCLTFQDPDGHWFQLVNPEDH